MKIKMDMDRYEEALERAKAGKPMDEVFPELKESEDERIRKEIYGFLNRVLKDKNVLLLVADRIGDNIPSMIPSWISYLEKQKEQKDYRKLYEDIARSEWFKKAYEGKSLGCDEEQKEQKPTLYWHKIKTNEQLPCKAYIYKFAYEQENNFHGRVTVDGYLVPNEPVTIGCDTWYLPVEDIKNLPKEDELDTMSPMKTVEQKPFIIRDTGCSKRGTKMPEYCLDVKPEGWSEEDERIYQSIMDDTVQENQLDGKQIDWLMGIKYRDFARPKNTWKPSEEQMAALEDAKIRMSLDGYGLCPLLQTLINDLKKLI